MQGWLPLSSKGPAASEMVLRKSSLASVHWLAKQTLEQIFSQLFQLVL